jgi:hypothetical protein
VVVFITFTAGYLERRASDRRQRTLDFLLTIIEGKGTIHDAHIEFANWASNSREIADDKVDSEDDQTIVRLLDYYDLVADTSMRGVIDKDMIILHLGGRMRSTYRLLERYIAARREKLARPGLYKPLELFVNNHILDKQV